MPVVMLLAALAVLAGIVIVASGHGGEMAHEHPDYPPLDLGPVTAADVALLRPPSAAWGYNMRVTDEAMAEIARAMSERDVQISALQQQVSDLRDELPHGVAPRSGARHRAPGGELLPQSSPELPRPALPQVEELGPVAATWPHTERQARSQPAAGRGRPDQWVAGRGRPDQWVAGRGAADQHRSGDPPPREEDTGE